MLAAPMLLLLPSDFNAADLEGKGVGAEQNMASSGAGLFSPPIMVDGIPPLICENGEVCPTPLRTPVAPIGSWSAEEAEWWFAYGPDLDWNGMDDRLQYILAGVYPSQSPTAITAEDGRLTVAVIIDFAWHPQEAEISAVEEILFSHGWVGEDGGATMFTVGELDSIIVDKVPQSALLDLYHLNGVVVIEQQNVMVPTLEVAAKAVKARASEEYTTGAHMLGVRGDGVVIAILDSGVDNEHRSLNDFDDQNDDPDSDANSYDDQKWLAGFDATDSINNQQNDGSVDPDDTAGHGTHVAGIALGTGGPNRANIGIAPGAYLVDVKVFTDIGRSNTQYTISGINWTINNKNTEWGNNASSNGIDIMSMSFGRARSPVGEQDMGDNGTSAEARIVNDAWDAGITPVCAMGNDGARYVAAPASADKCIAVAASDDYNTITRNDDTLADYSNWGPRLDDGDSDQWDELKPDLIAPGTNIQSAQHAASGPIGGTVLADDDYVSMSGTSMSTPLVSGLCALILQVNPNFEPADIKSALQNNSEFIVEPSITINGQVWNETEGFGRVDASQILDISGGDWLTHDSPVNGTWLAAGETYRIRGSANMSAADAAQVGNGTNELAGVWVSARYKFQLWNSNQQSWELQNKTAFNWQQADGVENWTFDLTPELWHDGATLYVEMRTRDSAGRWSDPAWAEYMLGENSLTLVEPSGYAPIQGSSVSLKGEYKAVLGESIEYRVGEDGDWQSAYTNLDYPYVCEDPNHDTCDSQQWFTNWDSTTVLDGGHVLYVRLVSENGWTSTPIERYIYVDNVPPSPDLEIVGDIVISENGVTVEDAFSDSFLNVEVAIRNSGDAHARNIDIILFEGDIAVTSQVVGVIDSTDTFSAVLGYHATNIGTHTISVQVSMDSGGEYNTDNNQASREFTVNPRPSGVDLAIRSGAARTNPSVSNPDGDVVIEVRVENLAGDAASGVTFTLERWTEIGWEVLDDGRSLNIVPGAGYVDVPFTLHEGTFDIAEERLRATVTYDGGVDLNSENNQLVFDLLVDESQLQGARVLDLPEGHEVLSFFGVAGENLLFTGDSSSIWIHRINSKYDLITCLELESDWAGEFVMQPGESDSAYVAWTRRFTDEFGVTQTTLSFTSVDLSCTKAEVLDLMPPLMLAEGTYWGIGLSLNDDGSVYVAGYHRDLFTSGTYDDITSIFLLSAISPLSSGSWQLTRDVVTGFQPPLGQTGAVHLDGGNDWVHLTFQATRDDETGVERVGTFYAHGEESQENWSFKMAIGDDSPHNLLFVDDNGEGEERLVIVWSEGYGFDTELVVLISDSSMQAQNVVRFEAAGLSAIAAVKTDRGIQLFHDAVTPGGRQVIYSLIDDEGVHFGTPMTQGSPTLVGRSDSEGETHIFYRSSMDGPRARMLIDDSSITVDGGGILNTIRLWTGLDERTFELAWKILAVACSVGITLMMLVSAGLVTHRRRRRSTLRVEVEDDDEVLDVDEELVTLVAEPQSSAMASAVDSESAEDSEHDGRVSADDVAEEIGAYQVEESSESSKSAAVPESEGEATIDGAKKRRERRRLRTKQEKSTSESITSADSPQTGLDDVLPPPPTPMQLGTLPPPPGRDVTCECGATFRIKSIELKRVTCPVCSERIKL